MIFVDTETTGLDPAKCSIISIGAVDFDHPDTRFYIEARPDAGCSVEDGALAINGFSMDYIWGISTPMAEALIQFGRWYDLHSRDFTVAGYNVDFDLSFIAEECRRNGVLMIRVDRKVDLKELFVNSRLYNGGRKRLDDLIALLGLGSEVKPHNALNGALVEAEAYARLVEKRSILSSDEISRLFSRG